MDATRISDGIAVILKVVERSGKELEITRFLSNEQLRTEERNHCVPLLDVLDPGEGNQVFLVEPLLRTFDDPKFVSVEDGLSFIRQLLEVRSCV